MEGTGRKREATALVCTLQAQRRHLHTLSCWDLNINFVVLTYQTKAGECPGDIEDVNGVTCVMCDVAVRLTVTMFRTMLRMSSQLIERIILTEATWSVGWH